MHIKLSHILTHPNLIGKTRKNEPNDLLPIMAFWAFSLLGVTVLDKVGRRIKEKEKKYIFY